MRTITRPGVLALTICVAGLLAACAEGSNATSGATGPPASRAEQIDGSGDGIGPSGAKDSIVPRSGYGYESTPLNNTYGYETDASKNTSPGGNYSDDYDYEHNTYGFGYHAEKCRGRVVCYRLEGRGY